MKPDLDEFFQLAKTYDIVPVVREIIADYETPVSILTRFLDEKEFFLLESVEGGERSGRFSFIGLHPEKKFLLEGEKAFLLENGHRTELSYEKNPMEALYKVVCGESVAPMDDLPPFTGGAVGYLGYDCIEFFEPIRLSRRQQEIPRSIFMLTDELIVFDNVRRTLRIIVFTHIRNRSKCLDTLSQYRDIYDEALVKIDAIERKISEAVQCPEGDEIIDEIPEMTSNMTKDEYCEIVRKAQKQIEDGEAIQIVLSQCFTTPLISKPIHLYRAVRTINPSPYTFFLKLDEITLIGSSPETLIKLENGTAILRPIAGTRKIGRTAKENAFLATDLLNDSKERAEHLMLVDLGRNDLGRTALAGTVEVNKFMNVERYSHVMHLTSEITSRLDPHYSAMDLLSTTFPAGTLSGAPKIRAMEIIDELEPTPRGVYGGALGYLSFNGNMDLAIVIRTMEITNSKIKIQAGAGIVYDSNPDSEYEETVNKAGALFQSVRMASRNLNPGTLENS